VGILTPDELSEGNQEKQLKEMIEDAYNFFSEYTLLNEREQDYRRDEVEGILKRMKNFISF
jgi:hypothetical protein